MKSSVSARTIAVQDSQRAEFLADVLSGLSGDQKTLNPKYFYDKTGSRLFESITELPEYYITRTETQMMTDLAAELAVDCQDVRAIVEFGSGSGRRSDILLSAIPGVSHYVPIDVSEELLASTSSVVEAAHPGVEVLPLVADFCGEMSLPTGTPPQRLGYFPGSTIGNFVPDDAISFLRNARHVLSSTARMLVGVDLVKPISRIEDAYNDSAGVTAKFNKNVLMRINSELAANFDLQNFTHQAFYNNEFSRIEMHLVSLIDQRVSIDGQFHFEFRAGESIHTENSHKFTNESFGQIAKSAGWMSIKHWVDDERLFSLHLLESKLR